MNPNQALSILDNAVANAPLTRANHVAVQQAIQVIAGMIRQFDLLTQQVDLLTQQMVENSKGGDTDEVEE